ncbi:IclR family transcriptional regulator [Novosphingobium rosa]|uniref:IclR family transcriptional regulator n=1 Tax=Novosphingobium rosa TaxID=76978 RepID=UPI00083130B3|nr:IclR family transcriptional regulator C-terminal domain-containing protein [Novosphingobium rosa]
MDTSLEPPMDATEAPAASLPKLGVIGQAIAILRFLAANRRPLGVNAIAREVGIAPSSCFKFLKQLCDEDFVLFDAATKCYSLGGGAIMLARRALDPANTFVLIQPMLAQFGAAHGVAVGFWRKIDEKRIVLAGFIEAEHLMRIHMSVGQRLPLYVGAVGRAFAADLGLTAEEIRAELGKVRWEMPPSFEQYREQVERCKADGYAVDQNNFAPGVTTVAVAFTDAERGLGYGISAIRFSGQLSDDETLRIGRGLAALKEQLGQSWLK